MRCIASNANGDFVSARRKAKEEGTVHRALAPRQCRCAADGVPRVEASTAFDPWANCWRQKEATGNMIIVRYADDIVAGFEHAADAHRFLDMMRTRLEEFALTLHPEKTRLIEFGRHAAAGREQRGVGQPETFK